MISSEFFGLNQQQMFLLHDLYEKGMCFHARLTLQGTPEVNQMSLKALTCLVPECRVPVKRVTDSSAGQGSLGFP